MKNKKRLTALLLIIVASLLSLTALHAAAAEETEQGKATVGTSLEGEPSYAVECVATGTDTGEEKPSSVEAGGTGTPTSNTDPTPPADSSEDSSIADVNIFTELYNGAVANMDKILSLLAFIASLFVGIIYKKRLIPTLSVGINNIGESINSFKENVFCEEEEKSRSLASMREELSTLEGSTRIVSEKLEAVLKSLEELLPKRAAEERTRIIMSAQVDLLYDVFMSSALPEYMKDEVGRRITEMREELDKGNEEKV